MKILIIALLCTLFITIGCKRKDNEYKVKYEVISNKAGVEILYKDIDAAKYSDLSTDTIWQLEPTTFDEGDNVSLKVKTDNLEVKISSRIYVDGSIVVEESQEGDSILFSIIYFL